MYMKTLCRCCPLDLQPWNMCSETALLPIPHATWLLLQEMYERKVTAGEILIKEGDTGAAASELFVVKSGEFEVRPKGQIMALWTYYASSRAVL